MNSLFLISESIKSLDIAEMKQSSQKYELSIAKRLSKYFNVVIISMAYNDPPLLVDNITLTGVGCNKKYDKINHIVQNYENSVLIFWGYDFIKVKKIYSICRKNKITGIPFIYDSHKVAIAEYGFIKRCVADVYFKLGIRSLRRFDGYIFFQKNAAKMLRLTQKPFMVTKPGVNINNQNLYNKKNTSDKFIVSYCGTLSDLNGLDSLLESLHYFNEEDNVIFNIYGDGPLKEKVIKAQNTYKFFHYCGLVSDKDLALVYANSDLLLNLRRLNNEVMDFAFPSKLFEYLETGIPVLTTKLLDAYEFLNCVYIIDKIQGERIADCIKTIVSQKGEAREKGLKAKKYVEKYFNYDILAKDIFSFIKSLLFKEVPN